MILVDIYIPAIEDNYDFLLDENVPLLQVMTEIREMVSKKVMRTGSENEEEFLLYSMDSKRMLNPEKSLHMNGIYDGSKLLLV